MHDLLDLTLALHMFCVFYAIKCKCTRQHATFNETVYKLNNIPVCFGYMRVEVAGRVSSQKSLALHRS